jgi:peptidyl-prolyl cis-trans isomerase C
MSMMTRREGLLSRGATESTKVRLSAWLAVVGLLAACEPTTTPPSPGPVSSVLAVVDGDSISSLDLTAFSASLPAGLRPGLSAAERRQALEPLIDKTVMLMEARATGLDQDPELRRQLEAFRQSRILVEYRRRHIGAVVSVTEAEVEERWRASNRDRYLRFGGVMVQTMPEALEVKALLEAGASLGELAASRSLHAASAGAGGQMEQYLLRDQVVPAIAEAIFHLPVGAISDPVPVGRRDGAPQGMAVFKVLDEIHAPLALSVATVRKELSAEKLRRRAAALRDSLMEAYEAQIHPDAVLAAAAASAAGSEGPIAGSKVDSTRPIASYRTGQVTIGEFLQASTSEQAGGQTRMDTKEAEYLLRHSVVPNRISLVEASSEGLDRQPALLAAMSRKKEELMLSLLRHREVDRHVTATDTEALEYYQTHAELFRTPETTQIAEILVSSEQLAQELKERIENGEDPQALARQHSIREGLGSEGGVVVLERTETSRFEEIHVIAQRMPIGSVVGPVRTRDGFMVFKVLDRTFADTPFEEARKRAAAFVRIRKAKTGFVDYVRALREKYRVRIVDPALAAAGDVED